MYGTIRYRYTLLYDYIADDYITLREEGYIISCNQPIREDCNDRAPLWGGLGITPLELSRLTPLGGGIIPLGGRITPLGLEITPLALGLEITPLGGGL